MLDDTAPKERDFAAIAMFAAAICGANAGLFAIIDVARTKQVCISTGHSLTISVGVPSGSPAGSAAGSILSRCDLDQVLLFGVEIHPIGRTDRQPWGPTRGERL